MRDIREMPEKTKEQINDKVKCFIAEAMEYEDKIVNCKTQLDINRKRVRDLLNKFREICLTEINPIGKKP
jgi:hypothetical protein